MAQRLRTQTRPAAISCNMRYESWGWSFGFSPSHRMYLNKFQQQNEYGPEWIYLCVSQIACRGTVLPAAAAAFSVFILLLSNEKRKRTKKLQQSYRMYCLHVCFSMFNLLLFIAATAAHRMTVMFGLLSPPLCSTLIYLNNS